MANLTRREFLKASAAG
ncbi:twin-arginine translocation signal domain-containing protein [Planctomycetota bacterium]